MLLVFVLLCQMKEKWNNRLVHSLVYLQIQIGHALRDSVGFRLTEQTYHEIIVLKVHHQKLIIAW